jgi:peptidoglycan hydrolase-like protein with peptidoglycan-binding domain
MTPIRARLTLCAIMAIFLATAGNALFLQERPRSLHANGLPSTAVSITQFPLAAASTAKSASLPPSPPPAGARERLTGALQRELWQRGYADQLQMREEGLRMAVLAYEFDNGRPLTGEPDEALLKHILFDLNQSPKGLFADRAEANPRLVMEVQKLLLGLGFFSGTLSGRMDVWTMAAVRDFQRHRNRQPTGRLTEATLLELISYSGQPIQVPPG